MASVIIPVENTDDAQRFDITLDGVDLLMDFFYLDRTSSWYVELREPNTNELIQGTTRLTVGYPIFFHDDPRLPPGQIFVFTGAQPPEPMRLRDLDTIAFIWYQSPLDYQPPSDPPTYLLGVS